jgi:hypothetical protein
MSNTSCIVAIPVKDEAERIRACLRALACQTGDLQVVLLVNNTSDDTVAIAGATARDLGLRIRIEERWLPATQASAGRARSLALDVAAAMLPGAGVLLTTDADGRVAPDWLAANLRAFAAGAEAVAGRAEIDPEEARAIPDHLHADDARECAYAAMLDQIAAVLDPLSHDPWPRHSEHSGASIAVTSAVWQRVGGMAPVPIGEDRAFLQRLERLDVRVRHEPAVRVVVSGRIWGRAKGGMADTMRRRMAAQDPLIDDRLEPATDWARRHAVKGRLRATWSYRDQLGWLAAVAPLRVSELLAHRAWEAVAFGEAWAILEAESTALLRRRVPLARLAAETSRATALLLALKAEQPVSAGIPR